jgi:ATP-dependent Clp protease ATP-binding subunit ClpC
MAQRVLLRAAQEALAWGQARVGVEFLLLAILREVPEIRDDLRAAGVPVEEYEAQLERVVPKGPPRRAETIQLSSGMKRILQLARVHAARLGRDFIGPEHLVAALALDGESFAAQFLGRARPDANRERIVAAGEPAARPAGGAGGANLPPNLSRFGRDLTASRGPGTSSP